MSKPGIHFALAIAMALALAGCGEGTPPGDAAGAKVLRNLLEKTGVGAKLVSFKKTQGREVKTPNVNAYEFWYEAELQFPQDLDAKCSDEKERGKCAYLGLSADQSFKKGEILRSEGTLNFVKSEKGWVGEDNNTY
jgi:ADP-ribose pyrophosphatase YjhB (NUDIX family)